ncbi:MAG: glutamate formimidoyltransferase, partial [Candidatus Cloacimonadota bacterium]|nr:glutamate formimidoyltransferase [Candidatus Cloacimonadota bacterium]
MRIIECVPNFSEGRNYKILDAISAQIKSVKGVSLLDVDPGADTNRTVFTMVGEPEKVIDAAFLAIKKASELIDMSKQKGTHPRMGATDVCPLIPVSEVTMEECIEYSKQLGKRVGEELDIPVYLYEYSASKPEWKNLANVRKGEYEALPQKMENPDWKPDFGPQKFNAKAGATAISAREFLIAYNINLNTRNKKVAKDIALDIREKGRWDRDENNKIKKDENGKKIRLKGLFTNCKAVGWYIDEYNRAQISMNLTNYKTTPPHIVLEKVRELATKKNVQVTGSELVGLIPKDAILQAGKYYLNRMGDGTGLPEEMIIETAIQSMGLNDLAEFDVTKKVIEYSIKDNNKLVYMSLKKFNDILSTDAPAPGGGSVAGLNAALAGSLVSMVGNLTIGRKKFEDVEAEANELAEKGQSVKERALAAIDKDTVVFFDMMDAMRLKNKTKEQKAIRAKAMEKATKKAIAVPMEALEISYEAVLLSDAIGKIGNPHAVSDAGVAAINANAAAKSAYL